MFGESVQILNGYGATETTSAVVTNVGVEFEAHPDSVGRPNLTADVRIVDPDGRDPRRRRGRRALRPLTAGRDGLLERRRGDRRSFVDGWFHSGDLGYFDDEGFLYVVDRLKDVVIRGGENVYCAEVEAVLHEHPDVAEVAVVGVAEPVMGERVCAVVGAARRRRRSTSPACASSRPTGWPRSSAPRRCSVVDELPTDRDGEGRQERAPRPAGRPLGGGRPALVIL